MHNILIIIWSIFAISVKAQQYPFEKFQAIKYKEYKNWKTILNPRDSMLMAREIIIPEFENKNMSLKIEQELKLSISDSTEYSELSIYENDRKIKEFKVDTRSISEPLPFLIADINGDGLNDLKIIFPNYGCGAFNYYCQVVFLFQDRRKKFNEKIYTDIFEEFENKPERDFNHDGKYEIITQTFQNFGKHNYWLFNIYNYVNGKLINVNSIADYPIMIPLNSYTVSKKISKMKMKEFEIKSPVK